jgi:DNA-binding MarR family transcriptional regulator
MLSQNPPHAGAEPALQVQYHYPQIYLACHRRHTRRRSSDHDLSSQDSAYLAHLDRTYGTRPGDLARHLGIGVPTLSAWVKRMQETKHLERSICEEDRRQVELRLTAKGEAAMQAASVLDTDRLRAVLGVLNETETKEALRGLKILAEACRRARLEYETGKR